MRGIYWEDYNPAGKPDAYRARDEFLQRVSEILEGAAPMDPEEATRAVFAAIAGHIAQGELAHVMQMVPDEVEDLFPPR